MLAMMLPSHGGGGAAEMTQPQRDGDTKLKVHLGPLVGFGV
jgi:hypothetical protein